MHGSLRSEQALEGYLRELRARCVPAHIRDLKGRRGRAGGFVRPKETDPASRALTAASVARDLFPRGRAHDVTVEVRNTHGERVFTVTVTMRTNRVVVPPSVAPFARA